MNDLRLLAQKGRRQDYNLFIGRRRWARTLDRGLETAPQPLRKAFSHQAARGTPRQGKKGVFRPLSSVKLGIY
jgi:hypothetical protein